MNSDILVPIVFFAFVFLIVRLLINHQFNKQQKTHEVLLMAIQKGTEIPAPVWQRFIRSIDPKRADLRKGLLFLAIASIPLAMSVIAPFQDDSGNQAMLILSGIPLSMGLLYLAFWLFGHKHSQ